MAGEPLHYAKAALVAGLQMLSPQDEFTVVAFDHEQLWWTGEGLFYNLLELLFEDGLLRAGLLKQGLWTDALPFWRPGCPIFFCNQWGKG